MSEETEGQQRHHSTSDLRFGLHSWLDHARVAAQVQSLAIYFIVFSSNKPREAEQ